jgi:hypothetical protein
MLPFQGEKLKKNTLFPARWAGLCYFGLSGRNTDKYFYLYKKRPDMVMPGLCLIMLHC